MPRIPLEQLEKLSESELSELSQTIQELMNRKKMVGLPNDGQMEYRYNPSDNTVEYRVGNAPWQDEPYRSGIVQQFLSVSLSTRRHTLSILQHLDK